MEPPLAAITLPKCFQQRLINYIQEEYWTLFIKELNFDSV